MDGSSVGAGGVVSAEWVLPETSITEMVLPVLALIALIVITVLIQGFKRAGDHITGCLERLDAETQSETTP